MQKMKKIKSRNKKNEADCPLKKHTAKSFALAFVLGLFIGLAVIIPGVSGSTVAIILGMYAALLYAIGNIFNDFVRCFKWLLPVGMGVAIGFLGGFLVIQRVFEPYMLQLVCLFAGLMTGAVPAILAEIKGEKKTAPRGVLLCIGFAVPLIVSIVSIALGAGGTESTGGFGAIPAYMFLLYIPLGAVVSATQIIPGLSATAILMACGQFGPILGSLHLDYILANPAFIGLMLCLVGGFAVGLVLISRAFSKLIERRRAATFFFVVGMSLGSIASMFLNSDMWEIYKSWQTDGIPVVGLVVAIVLLAIGFICSFLLTKYELNRKK